MLKNKLYRYGDETGRVPAHLHFGKEVYDNMLKNKDVVALINADTNEQMTYGEFAQMTADIALSLTRIGVGRGDVVCVCSERKFEVLPTIMGIICTGATFAPTDVTYGSYPLLHRVKIIQPKVLFCSLQAFQTHKTTFDEVGSIEKYILYGHEELQGAVLFKDFLTETAKLEDFRPTPVNGWEDNVFMVFSSGTTGVSKGVPVTHLGFLLNAQSTVRDEQKGWKIYNTREWYFPYGLMYSLSCVRVSATLVYNPKGGEKEMLEAVQKYKIKLLQLAPVLITQLINSCILADYDVTSILYIVSSSTYIREDEVLAIKKRLPNLISVLQLYGMSEGGSVCNEVGAPLGPRAGSSGVPCLGYVMKVVDLETRKPLGANQRGEICISGPSVTKGYLNNVVPDCKDKEGFLKTGDVGYYDEDGYFFIVNRIKELIKYNDKNVAPAEFEAILLQHPAVLEAGVVGKPDATAGELPVAFVTLKPGCHATEDELVEFLNSRVTFRVRLAGGVRFIDRLPRGAGDKLNRQELKNRLQNEIERL